MKTILIIPAFILMLCSIQSQAQQSTATPVMKPVASTAKLSYKIIGSADHTFGYDVYSDGRMMLHQPSIPGLSGNKGFKTKADAEKVAELVIGKIKKGEMPPTVSSDELKALKVI